jgi:aminocarboxymuconate-semialdehyde decarboxylase
MGKEGQGLTKRDFLKVGGMGAVALAGFSSTPSKSMGASQEGSTENKKKIDVHAHFHPPEFFQEIEKRLGKQAQLSGWKNFTRKSDTYMQTFSIEERMAWMDKFGIDKSVSSFTNMELFTDPYAVPEKRKEMSQYINDFFAETHRKFPDRALFFADVPLGCDVEFSAKEMNRAVTQLGLQGVCISTNNNGHYPQEAMFNDFFSEAERLDVPVFIHPSPAAWFKHAYTGLEQYGLSSTLGFMADATIMISYMILDGFFDRHKNAKIIVTHLGATTPYLYARIDRKAKSRKLFMDHLRMFYYDTTSGNPEALQLCESILDENRLLFGTDHPFVDNAENEAIEYLGRTKISKEQSDKIYTENALKLFKLKA